MLKNYIDNLTIKVAFDFKKIPRKLVFAGFGFLLGVNLLSEKCSRFVKLLCDVENSVDKF